MDLLTLYLLLRLCRRLEDDGQPDSDLDEVAQWLKDVFGAGCACYLVWCLLCVIGGIAYAVVDLASYLLRGR